jgi:hypothetical protein
MNSDPDVNPSPAPTARVRTPLAGETDMLNNSQFDFEFRSKQSFSVVYDAAQAFRFCTRFVPGHWTQAHNCWSRSPRKSSKTSLFENPHLVSVKSLTPRVFQTDC